MTSRNIRRQIAEETIRITEEGTYSKEGKEISVGEWQKLSEENTRLYRPEDSEGFTVSPGMHTTTIEVTEESTLAAARRCISEGERVLALNFASAKNPGGGFLNGSQAQEESLSRASGLVGTLNCAGEYYRVNRRCGTCLYTDHMILSPEVPVFRDDDDVLLDAPYRMSVITAPAVNYGALKEEEKTRAEPVMRQRIDSLLGIAADAGYETLILGAWGCGVFRNDPDRIAKLFAEALGTEGKYHTVFRHIVFAIYGKNEKIINAFRECIKGH